MKARLIVKKITSITMLLMLPLLASEIQLGQKVHEWMGAAAAVLFLLHHIMNYRWFSAMFKGNYPPRRILATIIDLLLLMASVTLIYSGIKMSGFVFGWLKLPGGIMTARRLHLFSFYWVFILMCVHTGMHRLKFPSNRLLKGMLCAASLFGVYAFIDQKIGSYLFLRTHFVFYDEDKGFVFFLIENLCMMVLFIVAGQGVRLLSKNEKE